MKECWRTDPNARLSALRLKKSVRELLPEPEPVMLYKPSLPSVSFSKTPSFTWTQKIKRMSQAKLTIRKLSSQVSSLLEVFYKGLKGAI